MSVYENFSSVVLVTVMYFYTQTNTFQCVLATDLTTSFAIFLYAKGEIQWTTGDSAGGENGLGGTPAQVGINTGDKINSVTVPESLTPEIINISTTSNVGVPGLWIFQVDQEPEGPLGNQQLYHCKKEMVALTRFLSPQLHLSTSPVLIKECAHKQLNKGTAEGNQTPYKISHLLI